MDKQLIEAAKEAGADIGTWDKSGNGINLYSFKEPLAQQPMKVSEI